MKKIGHENRKFIKKNSAKLIKIYLINEVNFTSTLTISISEPEISQSGFVYLYYTN